jgi:carbamoyl-phosphate synthase large subunit
VQTIHVAVTGVGNPLGQNIYKALAMSSLPLKIYLLDAYPFSAGLLWKGQPVVCPFVKEDNYIEELAVFLRESVFRLSSSGQKLNRARSRRMWISCGEGHRRDSY